MTPVRDRRSSRCARDFVWRRVDFILVQSMEKAAEAEVLMASMHR